MIPEQDILRMVLWGLLACCLGAIAGMFVLGYLVNP